MDFNSSIQLLYKELPTPLFKLICEKIKVSVDDIKKIIIDKNGHFDECIDECIDNQFDKSFVDLIEKYNNMRANTIYKFIHSKVYRVFNDLQLSVSELLCYTNKIMYNLNCILLNKEEKLMAREEFPLETYLLDKTVSLSDLAKYYPESNLAKLYSFITDNIVIISFNVNIKIERNEYIHPINFVTPELIESCAKYLYSNYKKHIKK